MNELIEIVFDAIKTSSEDKKAACLQKGMNFTGVYFYTILEYIQKANQDIHLSESTFAGKINAILIKRKIKRQLNKPSSCIKNVDNW